MSKNKRNQGIAALSNMDSLEEITKGANLKEEVNKSEKQQFHNKLIKIPDRMMKSLNQAKESSRIHASLNAYIIDAVREKMIKDELIKFN